jgi:Tol biopolymer transport system component
MIGTKLAHYDITSHLGNGGMGEVYQATDTKLGRSVAVKLLPEVFANDADRVARFEREARVLASLNHPNIAAIYGVEESSDRKFLVMELVPGETLAERIARSPIPFEEALDIAEHICEALEAAHEKGVVHRDLKPANVKITPEGNVKVLDFGLAKVYESANPTQNLSNSPTLSAIHTIDGVILGTAAYMSPEQARGRHVDRRGDIWAFGCVLYEMLTGRQAFPNGETVSDTLAGILKAEPLWNVLPANTPLKVRALLERCLRKEVRRRLPHIGEARIEIDEAQNEPDPGTPPMALVRSYRGFLWIAVAFLTFAAGIFAGRNFLAPVRDTRIVRFDIVGLQGATVDVGEPLSPDGRKVAYTANFEGKRSIWIRTLDSSVAEPLPGTEDATRPIWSADSQSVAFFAQGTLKRISATGGPPSLICNVGGRDLAWSSENVILIGGQGKPLFKVPATGGEPIPATELGPHETTHDYPVFLPDGRHFFYLARRGGDPKDWDVFVGSLDSKDRRLLPGIHAAVRYSPTGHVLYVLNRTLMARPFDRNRLELTGEAFVVAEPVNLGPRTPFSISANGSLAYLDSESTRDSQLSWVDRAGRPVAQIGPAGEFGRVALSPDDRFVAFDRARDVFLFDIEKGQTSRVTDSAAADIAPIWSPDGKTIIFASSRVPAGNAGPANAAAGNLYERAVGVVGEDKLVLKTDSGKTPTDVSRDGRYLLYISQNDVWALSRNAEGESKPLRLTDTPYVESNARFSADRRWIAYQSNESTTGQDIYIESFGDHRARQQVSTKGGILPRWRPDGKELFYVSPDLMLTSVSIQPTTDGLKIGTPVPLFQTRGIQSYEVSANGRFLLNVPVVEQTAAHVWVVHNWASGLKK